jgi:amino acid transporter
MTGTSDKDGDLRRILGVGAITVYAVGDILGAGIYALIGPVAAVAAGGTWLSFAVAGGIAALTALTLSELASRIPSAGGAASYCRRAFAHPAVAFLTGFLVLASGLVSAATIARAFSGYVDQFAHLPQLPTSLAILAVLGLINFAGIEESSRANLVATAIEIAGLVFFVWIAWRAMPSPSAARAAAHLGADLTFGGVLAGATVGFFAFVGFEDTVTVAEEARDPERTIPRALLISVAVCTTLYLLVTVAAQLALSPRELARSDVPLLAIVESSTGSAIGSKVFAGIALFAIGNTGLLNLITASRLTYGMAREGLAPEVLGRIHARRRTPFVAILVTTLVAGLLAISGNLETLAQTTSLLVLTVFTVLHVALLRLKSAHPPPAAGVFTIPRWIPVAGIVASLVLAVRFPPAAYLRGGLILGLGLLLNAAFGSFGSKTR